MLADPGIVVCHFALPSGGEHRQRVKFQARIAPTIARAAKLAAGKGIRVAVCQRITAGNHVLFDYLRDAAERFRR